MIGAVAQGLGGALFEEIQYDENGQMKTPTFMDYLVPTSLDVPNLEIERIETPSKKVLGGFKGLGEVNIVHPYAAIANAVEDALEPFKIRVTQSISSNMKIWDLLAQARAAST